MRFSEFIKIDGSLIRDIDHDKNAQVISQTIAEFVHSEAVLSYVLDPGIDFLQGYHLGEPVPIESLLKQEQQAN